MKYLASLLTVTGLATAQRHGFGGFHGLGGDHGNGGKHGWGWRMPGRDWQDVPTSGNSTFTQLTDHSNPSAGTFEQFYMYDTTFWKGPGSPVVIFTPGEVDAGYTSYLTTNRTTGVVAEKIGAATIVLEHRYWGNSTPFTEYTTANLTYLTLENSIYDITRFASKVQLPFAKHGSNAQDVPWVMMGGSYSGALTAWVESVAPGTIWAYHASSAVVESISDFWGYFVPVQEGMPKNCSTDVSKVIDYMDGVMTNGTADEVYDLKAMFGMQNVTHNDDFMAALEYDPWLWQSNQLYTGYTAFYQWCDAVEGMVIAAPNGTSFAPNATKPGPDGVGLEKALAGWADWWRYARLPGFCEAYGYEEYQGENNTYCFDTYDFNSPMFRDTSQENEYDRQWVWMTCNEPFGYWQTGAPRDRPSIVTRLSTPEYWIRQCGLFFPEQDGHTYGIAAGKTEAQVNAYTGGWFIDNSTRLLYVNGGNDPWREATVSAEQRPGGPLQSTAQVPVEFVIEGFHTSDLVTRNGEANAQCQEVIDAAVNQLAAWVAEFPKGKHWQA